MTIDEVGENMVKYLFHDGWAVKFDDVKHGDFRHFCAIKKDGPHNAFTGLDMLLFTIDDNPSDIVIRFLFSADPELISHDKSSIDNKVRVNNFEILRTTCLNILNRSGMIISDQKTEIRIKSQIPPDVDQKLPDVIATAYMVSHNCKVFNLVVSIISG